MSGPYHPLFVHFPIAFYLLGVLLTLHYLWRKRVEDDRFAYTAFVLSVISAVVASLVGLVDRGQVAYDDPRTAVLDQHITQGILFIILAGLVVYSRFRWPDILVSARRWWYLLLVMAGIIVLAATGWLGGELVYEWGVGVRQN